MQPSPPVTALVDRWLASGIITPEQAERIRADLASNPATATTRPASLVAEAAGYLGAAIVLVGALLLGSRYWHELSEVAWAGIVAGLGALLLVAGFFVPHGVGTTGARLRGVLWASTCVAVYASVGLTADAQNRLSTKQISLTAAAATAVVAAVLWALNRHVLQQLALVVSLVLTAFTGTMVLTDSWKWSSLSVWAVSALWFGLSLPGIVPQSSGGVLGAVGTVVGGIMNFNEADWGPWLAGATVVLLVAMAVMRRQPAVLAVGSVGTLIVTPLLTDKYFPGQVSAAVALVIVGLVLVALAVFVARRRRVAS